MAVKEQITVGEILVLSVDADPTSSGVTAPLSSLALLDDKTSSGMWIKTGPANTDWSLMKLGNQVTTSDATVTTLASFPIPSNTVVWVEAIIIARRTGGSAGATGDCAAYTRRIRYKNVAGTVTTAGLTTEYTQEDQTSWNATLDFTGTTGRVRVNGAVNNTVLWSCAIKLEGG